VTYGLAGDGRGSRFGGFWLPVLHSHAATDMPRALREQAGSRWNERVSGAFDAPIGDMEPS